MIIVTDVDCTLNNFVQASLDIYNKRHKTNYTMSGITRYSLKDSFESHVAQELQDIFHSDYIWDYVKPDEYAQTYLKLLHSEGHEIYFATANDPATFGKKVEWVREYFQWLDKTKIICIKNKELLKTDILIEDCVENLIAAKDCCKILLDYPWNRHVTEGLVRCYNWQKVYDVICKISKEEN